MYYKISSLVLNAGKHQNGSWEVFIAQPDAVKESLAGKLFLLAEIDGKKNDTKKVIDFIITRLDDFYYNDEKIFLQDKIEGLTLDNIFEAALTKLNKALLEFISLEKIVLRAEDTNLVLGLVFDNKLLFSNFGRNKAFLIYKRQNDYDVINVETSAADADDQPEIGGPVAPKFFSSVISGEIPLSSYFLFCNEALPEYLSNHDLINIITKLPPMVAAEQIKNALAKLNSFVPFLGIIVKNTFGLSLAELKEDTGVDTVKSAHNSISHLNYTEKKTEQMLAPAGLVNWQKISKLLKRTKNKMLSSASLSSLKELSMPKMPNPSGGAKKSAAARLIKEKMDFGRSRSRFLGIFKVLRALFLNLLNLSAWRKLMGRVKLWIKALHPRNRLLFVSLLAAFLLLSASLLITGINNKKKANLEYFNNSVQALELKKNMIDSYLLYNNQEGAKALIGESLAALDSLPVKGLEQTAKRDQLRTQIEAQKAQVQKLSTIDNPEMLADFHAYNASAETRNLIFSGTKLYAADAAAKAVYTFDIKDKNTASFLLNGDFNALDKPVSEAASIYYLSGNRLTSLDIASGKTSSWNLDGVGADDKVSAFQFYRSSPYLMLGDQNQVYKMTAKSASGFSAKAARLNGEAYLGDVIDMAIADSGDLKGHIILLKNNGQIQDYLEGKVQNLSLSAIDPALESASLLKAFNDKLFIMDKASKRILIFDHKGALLKQFYLPTLNNLKDFSVDMEAKTAYILNDDAVYSVPIE